MKALSLESFEDSKLRSIAAEQTVTSIEVSPIVQALVAIQAQGTTYHFNEARIRICFVTQSQWWQKGR
jgi:hypothetical protein